MACDSQSDDFTDNDTLQLPIDVIIHIMSYLSVSDRMSAGLVNRIWYEASLCTKFIDQQILIFGREGMDDLAQASAVLKFSSRPFYHFVFQKVELKKNLIIWEQFGSHMRTLVLMCCDLSERTLVDILKCCSRLETLCISACRECLMSGRLLDDEKDILELSEKFKSLKDLSLAYNRYLSDALFNRIVAICPNLESLSLMGCQVSFHCGLYKKFYPKDDTNTYASESVLTFLNILHYITYLSNNIKHLDFSHTLIDGTALSTLSKLSGLKLESLRLRGCDQLTIHGIRTLTEYQSHLKILDISYCARLTDASLCAICKLTELENFGIRRCRAVTNHGVRLICSTLKNLKELDISECEQLTGDCISEGFSSSEEELGKDKDFTEELNPSEIRENKQEINEEIRWSKKLEILYANALNLDEKAIECISIRFKGLRVLDVGYCFTGVTDKTIQMIFKNLVFLRILRISHCDRVSDIGLTGMGTRSHENSQTLIIDNLPEFKESKLRISLRSRAEEEIVKDAKRKQGVLKLCEEEIKSLNTKTSSGYSLIRLRGLHELDLSGCNKITDVSLKHAFAFSELKLLDLSKCQQITHEGLDHLTKNNPAIEDLNLSQCYNISDIGVSYIAQRLQRLKRLNLQDCTQLTKESLNHIKLYCKNLQYLDIRNCQRMTPKNTDNFGKLHIECSKQENEKYFIESKIPTPPTMPTRR